MSNLDDLLDQLEDAALAKEDGVYVMGLELKYMT